MNGDSDILATKVAERFRKEAMAVVLRNVAGHNWGWFSREDERMHLQTVDKGSREKSTTVRIWLENKGKRTFEGVTGPINGASVKKLQAKVRTDRHAIEDEWIVFMMQNGWLKAKIQGRIVTLTAYPGSHNRFTREIDLSRKFPGAYTDNEQSWDRVPVYADLDREHCALAVGDAKKMDNRNHIHLVDVLFVD